GMAAGDVDGPEFRVVEVNVLGRAVFGEVDNSSVRLDRPGRMPSDGPGGGDIPVVAWGDPAPGAMTPQHQEASGAERQPQGVLGKGQDDKTARPPALLRRPDEANET